MNFTKKELLDEFHQLRSDDEDFKKLYKEHEFNDWLSDMKIIIKTK